MILIGARRIHWWNVDPMVAVVVALTAAASIAVEGLSVVASQRQLSSDPWLMSLLVLLAAVASHFPIELTPKFKTNVATAAHFAMVLLFAPPVAVGLVGLSVVLGNGTLALRRNARGRRMRGPYDTLFNTAQLMVAAGIAAAILTELRPEKSGQLFVTADAYAIPLAALSMYLTSTGLVALVVGLGSGRNPVDVWLASQDINAASEAALYLIGLITAVISAAQFWTPLLMVLPTAVVYLSMKRAVILSEQTVAAVEAMADLVDQRDPNTAEHSKRVAANVALIAPAMGLSAEDAATIRLAARVHDLGKLALPDKVLLKAGKLTPDEFALMKQHPRRGYEVLSKFPQYRKGREIVLAHHERIDGQGYPRGLRGKRISLGAQIVAVADALDAMTSNRPYRAAMPLHQAMTQLRLGRGTQWSSSVVDAVDQLVNVEQPELAFGGWSAAIPNAS